MSPLTHMDLSEMLPLGEKRKILNQFVGRAKKHDVDDILKNYVDQPSGMFNLVKFLLADKFHRFDLMIELLFDGDIAIMNGILSKRWMYEDEKDSLTDSQFLLEQLFPNVSYICRLKVLHKIGRYVKNEVKVDRIWNAVEQRYGFDEAFPLLQACSKDIISSVIGNRKIKLSGYQVVQILQKYPEIGLEYLKNHSSKFSKMNPQCSPLHYLYENRFDDFVNLCINDSHVLRNFKIGRSRSTKIIRAHRIKLLENPKKTSSLLKLDRIQREFTAEEFQIIFESTLPKDPVSVEKLWKCVRTAPLYKQVFMINQAYANLYRIKLEERPEYMDAEYIFQLPGYQKLSAIEWKINNWRNVSSSWSLKGIKEYCYDADEVKFGFLSLKPISHAAPELKKLLLMEQNVDNRATLSKYLLLTCYFNEDLTELLKVLKLLRKRSRNDQPKVRAEIFKTLAVLIKKMDFSKKHWDIIYEMIQVSLVFEDDGDDRCYGEKESIIRKYIAFCLESKLPIDELVTMHIKLKISYYHVTFGNKFIKNPADSRVVLELYVKELENLELSNGLCGYDGKVLKSTNKFVIELIEEIWRNLYALNKAGSKVEPISLSSHQWLISNFERIAQEEEASLDKSIAEETPNIPRERKFVKRRSGKKRKGYSFWGKSNRYMKIIDWLREEHNVIVNAYQGSDYYFSKMWIHLPNHATVLHFLRKNPSHLIENWSTSLSKMLKTGACVALMRTLKHWKYSTFVAESINKCTELMNETLEDTTDKIEIQRKCNAVLVLSALKETSDFLALVAEFYPTEIKVDVAAENSGIDYEMRETIAYSLKNISVPHLTFDAIKKFCVGDYLKLILASLYSQVSRSSMIKSLDFLRQQLTSVPVSLQKHIIRLYCTISSVDESCRVLESINTSNVTIRNIVFLKASKVFRSYPSQETWTILKTMIDGTSTDDADILRFVHSTPGLDTCPSQYISEYVDACFALLCKLQPSELGDFIEHLQKIIEKIPDETLDKIIMYNFENEESFNATFCMTYLHSSSSESILKHRLSNVWCILNSLIQRNWDRKLKCDYPTRSSIINFIGDLSSKICDPSKAWLQKEICGTLLSEFKTLSTTKFYAETLNLHLALLHAEVMEYSGTDRLRQFGRSLAIFVDSLAETYGGDVIFIGMNLLECLVKKLFSAEISENESVIVELIDELLKTSKTRQNQIISIKFLRNVRPKEVSFIKVLKEINRIFTESNDLIVQAFYTTLHH